MPVSDRLPTEELENTTPSLERILQEKDAQTEDPLYGTLQDMTDEQLFPNAYVEPEACALNELIRRVGSGESRPEEILQSSEIWWKKRLLNRYYLVSRRNRDLYIESKKEMSSSVEELGKTLRSLEESDTGNFIQEYMDVMENQVWPSFRGVMISTTLGDNFDSRSDGSRVHFMNEILIPTLQSFERKCATLSSEKKKESLDALLNFAKTHFNTDSPVTDTFRYELLVTCVNIAGTQAFPYIIDSFNDLFEKIQESEQHLQDTLKYELKLPRDTEVVWAFNKKSGELGYVDKNSLTDETIPLGPETDEEFFTPGELEFGCDDHLLLHKDIVHFLGKFSLEHPEYTDQVVKFLCNFMRYNSQGSLKDYVEAFQGIGIDHSYKNLLKNLKSEDVLQRRMSAEILYRLEVGKIGITSEKGVSYFDNIYHLIKENDPDFFVRLIQERNSYVQRVDSSGSIGVFNGEGYLLGFFSLDLRANEGVLDALVHEISSKDVFIPKADEKPDERRVREAFLEIFLAGYGRLFEQLNRETGVKINSLELYEQGWFVIYYSKATEQERERLLEFISKYGELGLKVFLALDYGGTSEDILNYSEYSQASEFAQKKVLLEFYKISNRAFEWRKVFEKSGESLNFDFSPEVHEALIRKSSEYFRAALLIEQGRGGDVSQKELLESMESISFALDALKGLYQDNSDLILEGIQRQNECSDEECTSLIEGARTTWSFVNQKDGTRITVSVRPSHTYPKGNRPGGEARINFSVVNKEKGIETRLGVDLSDYGEDIGTPDKAPVVSLDLGTGVIDKEAGIYPSQRVGRVLGIVEGSEGGHNESSFGYNAAVHFKEIAEGFNTYIKRRFSKEQ